MLVSLILLPATAWSGPNETGLQELARSFETQLRGLRPQLYYDLLAGSNPAAQKLNDAPEIQLMYIRENGSPVYFATLTLTAAQSISTDDVWPGGITGYNLDGSGTTTQMAMWDGGDVLWNHETLVGRAIDQDGPGGDCSHPTWVAGVMIAAGGFNPDVKGMSFAADLLCYDFTNDSAEMALAAAAGLLISNHSYEIPGGWRFISGSWYWFGDLDVDPNEDYGFGFYGAKAQQWDQIAYDAPNYFIQKGCGNDRLDGPAPGTGHYHWDNLLSQYVWATDTHDLDGEPAGYDCVSWFGNAKNIVSVGAVEDIPSGYTQPSDVVATFFTSYGPCDDGRIKPDIVANGSQLVMPDCSSPTAYDSKSGTSLSGPCVASSANLLREFYESTFSATPRSATLKAILMHTADEAGPADGPDYQFGWGLMNTRVAADHIAAGPARSIEAHLADNATHLYQISLMTACDLRVTMVWTDPPGTSPAPAVDPPDLALVNDLNLRLLHLETQTAYQPWVLDGANPANPASKGDNVVDNIERVDIQNAPAGYYAVSVTHKGSLIASGGQDYSIVSSGDLMMSTGIAGPAPAPLALSAYPNPFNPTTTISFAILRSDHVRIRVFDVRGRLVTTLLDERQTRGTHKVAWNGRDDAGTVVAAGMYFVQLTSSQGSKSHAITLLK